MSKSNVSGSMSSKHEARRKRMRHYLSRRKPEKHNVLKDWHDDDAEQFQGICHIVKTVC